MALHSERDLVPVRYADFKTDMAIHPIKGDLTLSKNADAVKRAVRNLVFTGPYERFYRPYIGSGVPKYLFENQQSSVTAELIRDAVVTTITNFEKRARLVSVVVRPAPDENGFECSITFGIENIPDVVVISQILRRAR